MTKIPQNQGAGSQKYLNSIVTKINGFPRFKRDGYLVVPSESYVEFITYNDF